MTQILDVCATKLFVHSLALRFVIDKKMPVPWEEANLNGVKYVTSNFVLDEFFTFLARQRNSEGHLSYFQAAETAQRALRSDRLEILRPTLKDELEAIELLGHYHEWKLNFTDYVSCVLMKTHGVDHIFLSEDPEKLLKNLCDHYVPKYIHRKKASLEEKDDINNAIFIDTGAFYARYIKNDANHKEAVSTWYAIESENKQCITSNFVLEEFFCLLGKALGSRKTADIAKATLGSDKLKILRPNIDDELEAAYLFKKHESMKISFTDCVSFRLMRSNSIKHVFTFDNDFRVPGGFQLISK